MCKHSYMSKIVYVQNMFCVYLEHVCISILAPRSDFSPEDQWRAPLWMQSPHLKKTLQKSTRSSRPGKGNIF